LGEDTGKCYHFNMVEHASLYHALNDTITLFEPFD